MEEMSPSASITFRLTNPVSKTSPNHGDFTRIKLLTETASLLSDPASMGSFNGSNDDVMNQENESDDIMSSGDDKVTSLGKETIEIGDERILSASRMAIAEKCDGKGMKSVFELEYIPLWGSKSLCGKRPEMEDAVAVVPRFKEVPIKMFVEDHVVNGLSSGLSDLTAHFFGVYDGHGGSQVRWENVFTDCFQKVDDEVGGKISRRTPEIISEPVAPETVGSTAVVAVICSSHIIVANCGDSRAVLYRGKEVMILSNDHKPNREDEYARIEAAGGKHRKNGVKKADGGGDTGADPAAQAAADYLAMAALQKGSKDNVSVIVVDLKTRRKFKTKS
ncbi:hypothetical protein Ccrd_023847 [Cynara cardunculus var. scolymus]|uniref:protein-serine/threonine phosphatase n=1 Tax=Cynara cardunculus var. scolymus TaxID=59895 RepID=A0A103XW06_CYNCS|nr:hypothetical protein Ccrd_023847 [Cynara cardunculus var. scolymus]